MFQPNAAEGIHRIEHADVNCYIVEEGGRLLLVDAGLPGMWRMTGEAIRKLGRSPRDIEALILTHGHFDHVGFAARLQRDFDVPVYVHAGDSYLAAHPYRYRHERSRLLYPVKYPRCIPILTRMAAAGALNVRGIDNARPLQEDVAAGLPGRPEIVFTPGHTEGHCALHFRDRDTVLTGDALVTLDPYTGATGPHIVSAAATADTHEALESLAALAATGARTALPGHGEPWLRGVAAAVEQARDRGAS